MNELSSALSITYPSGETEIVGSSAWAPDSRSERTSMASTQRCSSTDPATGVRASPPRAMAVSVLSTVSCSSRSCRRMAPSTPSTIRCWRSISSRRAVSSSTRRALPSSTSRTPMMHPPMTAT